MKQQTHYYLIGGEIKKGSQMPKEKGIDTQTQYPHNYHEIKHWLSSLQPCSITDIELQKVITNVYQKLTLRSELKHKPIEVTDIVEEKTLKREYELVFKQPEQVESDEMKNLKLDVLQILQEEAVIQYNHDFKNERVIYSNDFDTVANQIINLFKNIK